jgi:pimeloyl-ACP methyl ester carboxylesterase
MVAITAGKNSTIVRYFNVIARSMDRFARSVTFSALRLSFALGSRLRPAAALRRAYRLFCTPQSTSRRRARAADPGDALVRRMAAGGEQISVYVWGNPAVQPYVLLAHGWSSHGLRFLKWIGPLRNAGYAVVGFDQAAHGRSTGERTNLLHFAEVLGEIGDHYGNASAVVGHSLGGTATLLALSAGLAADRVVLIAPLADPFLAASNFGRMIGLAGHLWAHLFDEYEKSHPTRVSSLQAHLMAPAIARPVLIVHDLADREVPWAEGERYARYWPDSRLLTTTDLGHHRIVDDRAVIDAALRFLRGDRVGERVVSSPNLPFGFA